MKFIALLFGFAGTFLIVASGARAAELRLTPQHPAAGQPFTIDFDYVTFCTGPLDPHFPPTASLEPASPSLNLEHIGVHSVIRCFERTSYHTVHMSAQMTGLATGIYPIYSEIFINNGFDPPPTFVLLQGNIAIGAAIASSVPALSPSAWILLIFALALVAARAAFHDDKTVATLAKERAGKSRSR